MAIIELPQSVVQEITDEVNESLGREFEGLEFEGVSSDSVFKNEDLILSFLGTLVVLLPGGIGKLAGQGVIVAAKAWFNANRHKFEASDVA